MADATHSVDRLGIEFLSGLGLPPVALVRLAAALECRWISCLMSQGPVNAFGYPDFDLTRDASLRREMMAAMRDLGVSISLGEGFLVRVGADIRDAAAC